MKCRCVLLLLVLLVAASAPTASAEEGNDTTTINIRALGQTLMGTFVEQYSCTRHGNSETVDIHDETWTFTGQLNGQLASASGTWEGTWNGKDYVGRVTEITTWDMGALNELSIGGRVIYPAGVTIGTPRTPIVMRIRSGDQYADFEVSGRGKLPALSLPLAVQGNEDSGGEVPAPCEGTRTFSVTNVAGEQLRALPRTGDEPGWPNFAALALVVMGSGAIFASRRLLRPRG